MKLIGRGGSLTSLSVAACIATSVLFRCHFVTGEEIFLVGNRSYVAELKLNLDRWSEK